MIHGDDAMALTYQQITEIAKLTYMMGHECDDEHWEDYETLAIQTLINTIDDMTSLGYTIITPGGEHDRAAVKALREVLLVIDNETGLPESAANGVTNSTGSIDEGVYRVGEVLDNARQAVAAMKNAEATR